jgi:hypothetical protein
VKDIELVSDLDGPSLEIRIEGLHPSKGDPLVEVLQAKPYLSRAIP